MKQLPLLRPARPHPGVAPVPLPLWGGRAAAGKEHLLLRAQRALKEGVVIRKRQGEPWFPLLLCACGA